jgi:alpha-tubulin suppressor-like RCC1 family protein
VAVSGALRCWGAALDGGSDVPVPEILPLPHAATAVFVGSGFGCALTSNGVECFGATALGTAPQVEQLSAGARHVCGINAGQVFCWGDDASGQLGVAASDGGFLSAPGRVAAIDAGATSVAAGAAHTCAIVSGQVQCWGQIGPPPSFDGGVIALASGDGVSCAAVPSQVVCWGRASPAAGTFALDAVALSVGSDFACAVLFDGAAQCWGVNDHGQLGSPDGGPLIGLGQVTAISTGRAHACAIGANLQVYCWGEGAHSKLGVGVSGDQPTPMPVSD